MSNSSDSRSSGNDSKDNPSGGTSLDTDGKAGSIRATGHNMTNRNVRLAHRPTGHPGPEHFSHHAEPIRSPGEGEVLLETLYVSVDPAMRVWMNDEPGYVEPVGIGEIMRAGGIARVLESRVAGFEPGTLVQGRLGWQSHPTTSAAHLTKLDLSLGSALDWIGPLGGTALTAYFGMRHIAGVKSSDTVLVSAASGGVGQIAAQIGKLEGARVVGIAGGTAKCDYLTGELGLDAAIDYKGGGSTSEGPTTRDGIGAQIAQACPDGIDVYFDNVGGPTLDAVLAQLRLGARVAICGRISQTASETPYGIQNMGQLIGKRARIEGFIVTDFSDHFADARQWLAKQLRGGGLRQRMHVLEGLDRAPEGLGMLFTGENTGKLVIRVADE